jgi:hypothetical protein
MKIVFTPDWFLTSDVLISVFSFLILCLFFAFAFKSYRLTRNKSTLYLGLGFLIIALAELAVILTKFVLYYDTQTASQIGQVVITYEVVKSIDIFYHLGFFFNKFLTLLGFYLIYKIPAERKISGDIVLIVFLLFSAAFLSYSFFYFYHITAFLILLLIIRNRYKDYEVKKHRSTGILILAFSLLAFAQGIFIFSKLPYLYVAAQSMQLISYVILLVLITRLTGKSKEIYTLGKRK